MFFKYRTELNIEKEFILFSSAGSARKSLILRAEAVK